MQRRSVLMGAASLLLLAAAVAVAPRAAGAQDFPSKPITLLVGFGAGGMTDVSSRIIGEKLEQILGVRVLVENKPGAGGMLAVGAAAEMPADGHTIVSFAAESPFTSTYQGRPVNLDDWAMVGGYMPQERVLFARQDAPFGTMEELIEYAKGNPVTFADGGSFWSSRVMEAFAKKHELTVRLVPFRSGAEGSAAILGGHVTLAETGVGTSAWHSAREGGLKILATLTPGGLGQFGYPDVPTLDRFGADYLVRTEYGYAVRGDTPPEIVAKLSDALRQAIEDPEVHARLTEIDLTPEWTPPEEYKEMLRGITGDAEELSVYLKEE